MTTVCTLPPPSTLSTSVCAGVAQCDPQCDHSRPRVLPDFVVAFSLKSQLAGIDLSRPPRAAHTHFLSMGLR